ncbi:unnamed protein product, partial [Meganyctiphanes norvegica]
VGGPWQRYEGGTLGSLILDHSLTLLATLLLPTRDRDQFLHHLKEVHKAGNDGEDTNGEDGKWVVVDSSGEEDEEDPATNWAHFRENDIVQILNQIPFEELWKHSLLIDSEGCTMEYDIARTTHQGILKLFAFTTRLIDILKEGLHTYAKIRYHGVTKRVCRLLRHAVEYVTDHWQNYIALHQKTGRLLPNTPHWASLQVEYDQMFERAVRNIFSSQRSGAWQFLAVIPYSSVSLNRLWKILYELHCGIGEEVVINKWDEWCDLLRDPDTRGQFHDRLQKLDENEAFYLLTAMANMAAVREKSERDFIE